MQLIVNNDEMLGRTTDKTLHLALIEKDKEIKRLKNGIKELDDMFYESFRISQNGYFLISEWELKDFTDKLKELKGGE